MSDYTVHDYQWLKDMHIELADPDSIEISPAELLVLAEASDRIPTYCAANSLVVAGRRSELSERLGVGMDKQIPFQCEPDDNFWIGARNALVIMCAGAFLVWLIVKVV